MSEILVLGAGMVGVSTALALQEQGHAVTLADRTTPGRETSFGNAGVIQVEVAEPYAMPRAPGELLRYALGRTNDLVWSPSGIASMAPALWRYWRASAPSRRAAIGAVYSQLTKRSTRDHAPLIAASGTENLITRDGLALVFRKQAEFEAEAANAARLSTSYGIVSRVFSGDEWLREEPALKVAPAGVVHYSESWSVSDPGALTAAYADLFERNGGRIVQADANTLSAMPNGWRIDGPDGPITAAQAVLCLGPWTGVALRRFGLRVPMVLKRGYHAHYNAPLRPRRPFLDADNGVVFSPMRDGLRMATGAALVPQDAPADPRQLRRAERQVQDLIDLGPRVEAPQWFGTRPCLPGMLPMVGAVPGQTGLWVNFGHGHQGLTLGPTTAALLAEAMAGATTPLHDALAPAAQLSRT